MAFGKKTPIIKNRRITRPRKAARKRKFQKRRLRCSSGQRKYSR